MSLERSKDPKRQDAVEDKSPVKKIFDVTNPEKPGSPVRDFPVVALGASAGGLEAFIRFFSKVPKTAG
jgi:chemotaxis response regulator CheB